MSPLTNEGKDRLNTTTKFQYISYSVIVGTAILLNAKDKIIATFNNFGAADYGLSLCQTTLIATITFLIFFWITETAHEFQMLQDNLTHAPIVNRQAYLAILAVAVVLGTLGYFYDKIIIFSIIFATYNLFNMWAVWVAQEGRC